MTIHAFVNTNADDPTQAGTTRPSNWNATHVDGERSISTNTVGVATDDVIFATGGAGGISYTLPSPAQVGRVITVIKVDSAAGNVTILPNGSEKINYLNHLNGTSYVLANAGQVACLVSDGTNWWLKYGS